jgi:hypothetical protein
MTSLSDRWISIPPSGRPEQQAQGHGGRAARRPFREGRGAAGACRPLRNRSEPPCCGWKQSSSSPCGTPRQDGTLLVFGFGDLDQLVTRVDDHGDGLDVHPRA